MNGMVRIRARLDLKTEEDGGRRTPIPNRFRTDLNYVDNEFRMVMIELEKEYLFPGETATVVCNILLHSENEIDSLLCRAKTFIADGSNVIGDICLTEVIDRDQIRWTES